MFIGSAWHWVGDKAEDHNAAMTELARVLKPKGILAVSAARHNASELMCGQWIWNLEDQDAAAEWVRPVRDVYEKYEGGSPQYRVCLSSLRSTGTDLLYSSVYGSQR